MAAITETDKMNFRTQMVNGKPQIFYDAIDDSSTKARSKRNSRAINTTTRQFDQRNKGDNQKYVEPKRQPTKNDQSTNKKRVNEDDSLGVYMTMDEIADLVTAVKENSKNDSNHTSDTKALSPPRYHSEPTVATTVPNLDLGLEPPPLPVSQTTPREETLNRMASKKREKWLKEKAEIERMQLEIEYDQLKHQLSPRQKKNASPQRSTFQYDFPPPTTNKSSAPASSKQNGQQYDMSTRNNEDESQDPAKTRLMEKKQQQWNQENSDKMPYWDPFGRPGAGAPKRHDTQSRIYNPIANVPPLHRSPPRVQENSVSAIPPTDRGRVPAAMRTNIAFGNDRHQEDVETLKEMERRQWLDDLHKQIEENKRKKYVQQESERRQDFLRDKVHPLVQEAASRHPPPPPSSDVSSTHHNVDVKSNGATSNQRSGENLFGSNSNSKSEPPHLHVGFDRQQAYRPSDARRDEAVNTVDATFRGDQTDYHRPPNRRGPSNAYEDSDLPPQVPNHRRDGVYRNNSHHPGRKTTHMHCLDDNQSSRHTSHANHHMNAHNTSTTSQMNGQRTSHGPTDVHNRPLWNYNQQKRGEYVPNSKRDPHYEKRQRLKNMELGNYDCIDDVQKKTCYNRWNSDSEIEKKQVTRARVPKTASHGHHKDESIMNLLRGQHKQQNDTYGTRYPPSNHVKTDDQYTSNHPSSLERYDNYVPYSRTDEAPESSQPVETTSYQPVSETNANTNYQARDWENTDRQYPTAQPIQYSTPATKQEQILQQLSTIRENMIRRQREVVSPI
ncbi:unnamed protein product [Adineta ricciae]|uniref:Uncharacterized protein n=1 Tax=Adineta ricciae TaxID=249248 RepID=A0A814DJ84_ADIRI|nr:unnamed protein product [Adineta ricciae]